MIVLCLDLFDLVFGLSEFIQAAKGIEDGANRIGAGGRR